MASNWFGAAYTETGDEREKGVDMRGSKQTTSVVANGRAHFRCALRSRGTLVAAAMTIFSSAEAAAQRAAAAHQTDALAARSTATEARSNDGGADIVVTANRRSQNLQDVALSIQAVSGTELKAAGVVSAADLPKLMPGVQLGGAYGGQFVSFAIRGVVQQDFTAHAEGPIALYLDDGYVALNNASALGLFDLDRVEVLKGPQGTLFGRNATGGLVHIVTKKPSQTPESYATLEYSSYNSVKIEAAAGGPVTSTLSARVAGQFNQTGSYIHNAYPGGANLGGQYSYSLRGHLLWQPSSEFDALLSAYRSYGRLSSTPYYSKSSRQIFDSSGTTIDAVNFAGPTLLGTTPTTPGGRVTSQNRASDDIGRTSFSGIQAQMNFTLGNTKITSVTDYKLMKQRIGIDLDATESDFVNAVTNSKTENYSQELRAAGSSGDFRWLAGVFYLHIDGIVDPQSTPFPVFGPVLIIDKVRLKTNSYSGFAQAELKILPQLTLVGGVRVTRENKDFAYNSNTYLSTTNGIPDSLISPTRAPIASKKSETLVTAKAQAEYRPSAGWLLYAGWNRGTKSGSFNAPYAGSAFIPLSQIPYRPEVLNAFEAGAKGTFLDGAAVFNGAVFYYDYHNYQAFLVTNFDTQVVNRDARTYGAEGNISLRLGDHFRVKGGLTYLANLVKGVDVGGIRQNRRAPFTSKWTGDLSLMYRTPVANGELTAQIAARYASQAFYSISNYTSSRIKAYTVEDLRLTWTDARKEWQLSAFVQNVFDKKYVTVGFDFPALCGCSVEAYGRPRWVGASVTRSF